LLFSYFCVGFDAMPQDAVPQVRFPKEGMAFYEWNAADCMGRPRLTRSPALLSSCPRKKRQPRRAALFRDLRDSVFVLSAQ